MQIFVIIIYIAVKNSNEQFKIAVRDCVSDQGRNVSF